MTFTENKYKKELFLKLLLRLTILLNVFTFVGNGIYAKSNNQIVKTEIAFKLNSKKTNQSVCISEKKLFTAQKTKFNYFYSTCWTDTLFSFEKLIKERLDKNQKFYFLTYKSDLFYTIKTISENSDNKYFISIIG
jgi:hypothetical protein